MYQVLTQFVSSNRFSLVKYNVNVYETVFGYTWPKTNLYFLQRQQEIPQEIRRKRGTVILPFFFIFY